MDKIKYAYFAGFLDGEGTFTINKAYYKYQKRFNFFPAIQCGMADTEEQWKVLEELRDEFGGYLKRYPYRDKVRDRQRDLIFWRITTQKARKCAEKLLSYLVVKRKQAEILIKLAKFQGDRNKKKGRTRKLTDEEFNMRMELVKQIRQLNLRGMAAKYRQNWAAAETERSDTQKG